MLVFQDLIGSVIIGGIILLMLLAFNGNLMESAGIQTFKTTVQSNLTSVTDILEYDFRKMGYGITSGTDSAIIFADTNKITFKGDFNNDGTMDTLQYYIDTVKAYLTPNAGDRVLHRMLNNKSPQAMYLGMTGFKFQYYDARDTLLKVTPIPAPSKIKLLKIIISIESKDRIYDTQKKKNFDTAFNDTSYAGAYWERHFKPKNLK